MITAVGIAVTVVTDDDGAPDPALPAAAREALRTLSTIPVVKQRVSRDDYQRSAFGSAWSDEAPAVSGGGNGCDTRNDILRRDLRDVTTGASGRCPDAVLTGQFRSPYTGEHHVFRRDRDPAGVQIDHIVALAYAWDMGAWAWTPTRRLQLANDPANLVAVDAVSNQAKSDGEPAVWLPRLTGFRCRYGIQFILVSASYHLAIDEPSRAALVRVLAHC